MIEVAAYDHSLVPELRIASGNEAHDIARLVDRFLQLDHQLELRPVENPAATTGFPHLFEAGIPALQDPVGYIGGDVDNLVITRGRPLRLDAVAGSLGQARADPAAGLLVRDDHDPPRAGGPGSPGPAR